MRTRRRHAVHSVRILLRALASCAVLASAAQAGVFSIRPMELISGNDFHMTVTGTISTIGSSAVLDDWTLTVTTVERLGHYTPANTKANLSQVTVSPDGQQLSVATSPDPLNADGGFLGFRSPNPFQDVGAILADFTTASPAGGQAMYMSGAAFDFLNLNQPASSEYLAAQASPGGGNVFDLTPLDFGNGVELQGTIQTDGTRGSLAGSNIQTWDIDVDMVTRDVFTRANSVAWAQGLNLSTDGQQLTVDNPDGSLMFVKGFSGGHLYGLQLADFSDQSPPGGQAGYYQGRLAVTTILLGGNHGAWAVTGTDTIQGVPEPSTLVLFTLALAGLAWPLMTRRLHARPIGIQLVGDCRPTRRA